MNEETQTIYIPVSLRLITWTKEIVQNGVATNEDRRCWAFTTGRGHSVNVLGTDYNATSTYKVGGNDLNQATSFEYAQWQWDFSDEIAKALLPELGKCYMQVEFIGDLTNVVSESPITIADYQALQTSKQSYDDVFGATPQAV